MHTWCGHWQAGNGTSPITDAGPASSGRWQPPCWLLAKSFTALCLRSHICYFSYFLWHLWIFKPDVLFPSFSRLEVEVFVNTHLTVLTCGHFSQPWHSGVHRAFYCCHWHWLLLCKLFEFCFSINKEMLTISTGVLWIDCYVWRGSVFFSLSFCAIMKAFVFTIEF